MNSLSGKILKVSEELEGVAEQCEEGLLRIGELQSKLKEVENTLLDLLPAGSAAFRVFDRGRKEIDPWWSDSSTGYVDASHCKKLSAWRSLVGKIFERSQPVAFASIKGVSKQYFLEADNEYKAVKVVYRVLRRAKDNLLIVDPYLDGTIYEYLDELDENIKIKLITSGKKPIFKKLLKSRPVDLKPAIVARECAEFHDRFILIDEGELWHLGASINHIGKKSAMLNLVVDGDEKEVALNFIRSSWDDGTVI